MSLTDLLMTAALSILPISELRGAIPYALTKGADWRFAYIYCVGLNALVAPLCWIFLATFHKIFERFSWYKNLFNRVVEGSQKKIHSGVERWGWLGIALFVAIPFPLTGAWTGVLGAWVIGLGKRKTMAAVVLGVLISGAIVSAVMKLGVQALDFFVKRA